jgi:MFS family permease
VTSIFNISSGCLILFWGRLADIYGRKTVFLAGTAAYTVASALLPFSPNQIIFYLFRAFQGVSVAAAVPASIGIISSTFPAGKRRNYAFVFYNAASSLGAVMGNIVGGVIGGYLSWKWIFWIAAMMGGFTGVAAFLLIPSSQNGGAHSRSFDDKRPFVDWIGGLLITASLLTLLIPLSNADGWKDACNGIQLASSVILGTAFILWQRHLEMDPVRQPLIRPSILNSTRFSAALVVYACFLASYNTFLVYASFL